MLLLPALTVVTVLRSSKPGRIRPLALPSSWAAAPPETAAAEYRAPGIRGRILDAGGDPVAGANVRLVSSRPAYRVLGDVKSGGDGGFSFLEPMVGAVRVIADHDPGGTASSAELRVEQGRTIEVTLVLSTASTLVGTVVDTDDHPIAGAALSLDGAPWIARSTTSDSSGTFRLTRVPQEATSVVAAARGYRAGRVAIGHHAEQADLVVHVRLATAPPIEGDVQDADGKPVSARIVACEGQPTESRAVSTGDGTFQLPPSAIGCSAVAMHDEYAPSERAEVRDGQRLVLRLKPGGAIDGVVVDERGRPVSSFDVGIESFASARARSRANGGPRHFDEPHGVFHWDKLAPGTYVLSVAAGAKPPARSEPVDVPAGSAAAVSIVLPEGGTVTGHVYDEGHAPIPGVDLRFDAVSSVLEDRAETTTDEGGSYRLAGAPSGVFTLLARKQGFRSRMVSGLRVDARGILAEDVTLTAIDSGSDLELGGIGAGLAKTPDGISLRAVFPGDPAERAGLHEGDRIVRIDGEDTNYMSLADALQRLRGAAGTTVGVSVLRKSGEAVEVLISRTTIVR
jgi:carboxypeptidase family protein/PDZ domain-containing protein